MFARQESTIRIQDQQIASIFLLVAQGHSQAHPRRAPVRVCPVSTQLHLVLLNVHRFPQVRSLEWLYFFLLINIVSVGCVSQTSTISNAGSSSACPLPCPAGTYSLGGSFTCSLCIPGTYTDTSGSSICYNVTAGCMSPLSAATSSCPITCSAGQYSTEGSTTCIPIDAGCTAGGSSATASCPALCAPGTWSQIGFSSCVSVEAGCYGINTGDTTPCPFQCTVGQYSVEGSTVCSLVQAGFYLNLHRISLHLLVITTVIMNK